MWPGYFFAIRIFWSHRGLANANLPEVEGGKKGETCGRFGLPGCLSVPCLPGVWIMKRGSARGKAGGEATLWQRQNAE